jgi:hypothetical protein
MILINLLPPELRKRGGGVSPIFASIVGGGVVNGILLLFFLYVQFVRLPAAVKLAAEKAAELDERTTQADAVLKRKEVIAQFEARRDRVLDLLASKMFLARNLDDFANLLAGKWALSSPNGGTIEQAGVEVRALDLTIKDASSGTTENRGPSKTSEVIYAYKWKYQIVGPIADRGGDYVRAFFYTIENSPFWRGYNKDGFIDKPETPYLGDHPEWVPDIQRSVIENSIEWKRRKSVDLTPKPKKS